MLRSWPYLVVLYGCAPQPAQSVEPEATEVASSPSSARVEPGSPEGSGSCVPLVEADVVNEAFARGSLAMKEAQDGEHMKAKPYRIAIDALQLAAQNGHLAAQSLYGRMLFGALFTSSAPEENQRDEYVSAVMYLRVAAKAGDEQASGYLPGLLLDGPPFGMPLDSLPEAWVVEAFAGADSWIGCYGLPQVDG